MIEMGIQIDIGIGFEHLLGGSLTIVYELALSSPATSQVLQRCYFGHGSLRFAGTSVPFYGNALFITVIRL